MALQQDISPVNPALVDTIVASANMDWIETEKDMAYMKILYTGSESGQWAVLLKWNAGYVAAPHKHLSASHTFILKGKLEVRDGVYNAGDYIYEPNGVLHGATKALEDTEYLFICNGPVLFYDDDGLTNYLSWEELVRMQNTEPAKEAAVG